MFIFLKKQFGASYGMRVVIALLYGFVNFTLLLNHTCYSINEDLYSCHLEDSNYHFAEEKCTGTHLEIEFNQNDSNRKALSCRQSCSACLYSLTSKLYKFNRSVPQVLVEAFAKVRFKYHLNFTKQFEWLSSAPLRAPPAVIS